MIDVCVCVCGVCVCGVCVCGEARPCDRVDKHGGGLYDLDIAYLSHHTTNLLRTRDSTSIQRQHASKSLSACRSLYGLQYAAIFMMSWTRARQCTRKEAALKKVN